MSINTMKQVWDNSKHSGTKLNAMLALADMANDDGYCWPGLETIAKRCRITKRSAIRIIDELEKSGELFAHRGRGRKNTNQYIITIGTNTNSLADHLVAYLDFSVADALAAANEYFGIKGVNSAQKVTGVSPNNQNVKGDTPGAKGVRPAQKGDTFGKEKVSPASPDPLIDPSVDPSTEPLERDRDEQSEPADPPTPSSPSRFQLVLEDPTSFDPPTDKTPKVPVSKPRHKPQQRPTPHIDPRKFVNGYIPAGKGETAPEIWCERFKYIDDRTKKPILSTPLEEDIVRAITDNVRWRDVVIAWSQSSYSPKNIRGMLDWYRDGIPVKWSNNNGSNGKNTGSVDPGWTGDLVNGSHNHLIEVPEDTWELTDW